MHEDIQTYIQTYKYCSGNSQKWINMTINTTKKTKCKQFTTIVILKIVYSNKMDYENKYLVEHI